MIKARHLADIERRVISTTKSARQPEWKKKTVENEKQRVECYENVL